jgi:DNA polymerase III alpha subunit (gram-positive type)
MKPGDLVKQTGLNDHIAVVTNVYDPTPWQMPGVNSIKVYWITKQYDFEHIPSNLLEVVNETR